MKKILQKNKYSIVAIVLTLFAVFVVFFFQKSFSVIPYGELSDNELRQDLGTISMSDGIKKIEYKYTNYSLETLSINSLYTSCMCTKAKLIIGEKQSDFAGMKGHEGGLKPINPQMELNPGETAIILAEFDPNVHGPDAVGPINRSVFMHTTKNTIPQIELMFTGNVTK